MTLSLEKHINKKLHNIFTSFDFNPQFAVVKTSDRPDLSDFQCNGALALAKAEHKNPREIATKIAEELQKDSDFSGISVDGPGFLNIKVSDTLIAEIIDNICKDERLGCETVSKPKKIVTLGGIPVESILSAGETG